MIRFVITHKNCVNNSAPESITIFKFYERFPSDIEHSLLIRNSFKVDVCRRHTKVATQDLINGFTNNLAQLLQVTLILSMLENISANVISELGSYGDKFLSFVNDFDDKDEERRHKMTFKAVTQRKIYGRL